MRIGTLLAALFVLFILPTSVHARQDAPPAATRSEVDAARRSIRDARTMLRALRRDLDNQAVIEQLDAALAQLAEAEAQLRANRTTGWLQEGAYRNGRRISEGDDPREEAADRDDRSDRLDRGNRGNRGNRDRNRQWDWDWDRDDTADDEYSDTDAGDERSRWRHWDRTRFRDYAPSFVGDFSDRWPFHEAGPYRPIPAVRYNRVDGLVLGVRQMPLEWDSYDRARIYGQVGYAFGLDRWRYEAGAEARLGDSIRENPIDLKIGGAYHRDTATNDLWKATWAENSLGAFFFRSDSFDYFETEGWTVYAVSRLTPQLQVAAAYRADDYESLRRRATWSLFGGDPSRDNPAVRDGRMQSVVFTADGGRVSGMRYVPQGLVFRVEAELGKGMGGDFAFNRYLADVRGFLRTGTDAGLAVRFRGGTSTGTLPYQKAFTLGGIGSVRAYPQNLFIGSRMLLANAEFTVFDVDLLDGAIHDLAIFGLADAGWVGEEGTSFQMDDVIPAAGFGVAFSDRHVRLELAWPLRDLGTGREPTVWLRLNPTF